MKAALLLPLLLAACVAEPRLNAGISIASGGVSGYPSVSGRVGPARVAISP